MQISLINNNAAMPILVETDALAGVRRIAQVVSQDIALVTGKQPELADENIAAAGKWEQCIFCATVGHSPLLDAMVSAGKIDISDIEGKWEVYKTALVEQPFAGVERAVVIVGSDKRGTIYGMFSLSEYIGVSPFVFWGDVAPAHVDAPVIGEDFITVSKEPSVKYRGFFINDEWPCYGNWVCEHYGGFTSESYEQVFQFLLRMKGNYLWPAMWSSSFPLDGPGDKNEEVADLYGVVMGYSHHEPCLRASEEWDKVRGVGTKYGNEWNFVTNEQGLLNYWEDALIRSGKFDNLITIGMRGERDTSMLGEDSTMQENVELLKDIICKQKALIDKHVRPHRPEVPMLLALYKEVEQYFYGNEEIKGLNEWEGLNDVICMLCEDNFGQMRTLPTAAMKARKQKFGMYYHLDYHGGPVSYEWVDSTPFSKIWEQMCQAYDFGIRDVWIVNVGDVKFHEVPLSYFMNLAYDYEKWGSSNTESAAQYVRFWCEQNFPACSKELREKIGFVLDEYINLNHLRRPESLHSEIYHPCHYGETDRMLARIAKVQDTADEIYAALDEREKKAFYSCIYYALKASMNNIRLHLYAGKNHHYAAQGRQIANEYKKLAEECLKKDAEFIKEFAAFEGGKWNGMQLAAHIGFTKWNEDGCKNPVLAEIYPVARKRMNVSRKDAERIYDKVYGRPMTIDVSDFLWEGIDSVVLEIANDGPGTLHYEITAVEGELPKWLGITPLSGDVATLCEVTLSVDRTLLTSEKQSVLLKVTDKDTVVFMQVSARGSYIAKRDDGICFYEQKGACIMRADHFYKTEAIDAAEWKVIDDYGKYGAGLKVFPVTNVYAADEKAPAVTYRFCVENAGEYTIKLFTTPSNPAFKGESVNVRYAVNDGAQTGILELIPSDFRAGENSDQRWCNAVLDQIRVTGFKAQLNAGINTVTIYPCEAGVVLQQIGVYQGGQKSQESYLGQEESVRTN